MPKSFSIKWEGDELLDITLDTVKRGIDETTAETASIMKGDAPRASGDLAEGIHSEPASLQGKVVEGFVGADAKQAYAVAVEANHPSKAGFMRRAAEREFPKLTGRIAGGIR